MELTIGLIVAVVFLTFRVFALEVDVKELQSKGK